MNHKDCRTERLGEFGEEYCVDHMKKVCNCGFEIRDEFNKCRGCMDEEIEGVIDFSIN